MLFSRTSLDGLRTLFCFNELKWFHLLNTDRHFITPRYFPFLVLQLLQGSQFVLLGHIFERERERGGRGETFSLSIRYTHSLVV